MRKERREGKAKAEKEGRNHSGWGQRKTYGKGSEKEGGKKEEERGFVHCLLVLLILYFDPGFCLYTVFYSMIYLHHLCL